MGLLLMGIAAWGGLVAFVGPTFDFTIGDTRNAWVWNESHATLHFAPAIVGMLGGLVMLMATRWARERLGALLALTSGVWFLIGPTLEPLWNSGGASTAGLIGSSGTMTQRVLEGIGYHYGTGAAMVMLSAFALGLLALAPATAAQAAAEPAPHERRRRRLSFRHPTHA
jgi:hypothetical protein